MAITARDVLERARRIALDEASVRWPLSEALDWLNDGQREIALHKPSAFSRTVVFACQEGTLQTIPAGYNQFLSAIRNLKTSSDSPRQGGRAVTAVDREDLDGLHRDWHDTTRHPARAEVRHVVFDANAPQTFYVYPANTGTGFLELILAKTPAPVALPPADADVIDSYGATLETPDIYLNALVDYVLYRCYTKDAQIAGLASRAAAHYQQFATAIGLKLQREWAYNPNRKESAA